MKERRKEGKKKRRKRGKKERIVPPKRDSKNPSAPLGMTVTLSEVEVKKR